MRTCLGLVLAAAAGCGPSGPELHPAGGRVTFKGGGPVPAGAVEFDPAGGAGPAARGKLDADGRFTLSTGGRPGAAAGAYRVVIVQLAADGGAGRLHKHKGYAVHRRYASPDKTDLTREVVAGRENEFTIEVDPGE